MPARPPASPLVLELAVVLAVAVAFADSSIVVLALPELYGELETSIVGVSWVVTAYNVAVAAVVVGLLPLERRFRPVALALVGLGVFLAASIVCAAAGDLVTLVAGRGAQGLGAALVLAASLPLLVGLAGSRERAVALWVGAGTIGAAAGPALGGVLTSAFDWRAIFIAQAPVAGVAAVAALHPRARTASRPLDRPPSGYPWQAGVGLAFAFAGLVGALFLAVLVVVTVWDYGPLAGAGIVSVLPAAALAARPLSSRLTGAVDVVAGSSLLAAGLAALALLPDASPLYAVPALALAGAGLGLALPPLTRATLPAETDLARTGIWSVGVRHLGLVLGLVAIAPLLAHDLGEAEATASRGATAVVLDARLSLDQKLPIALGLYDRFQATPEGQVPDLAAPFDERGADRDEGVRDARDRLVAVVEDALTRGFRSSFALSALFAALAAGAAFALPRRRGA